MHHLVLPCGLICLRCCPRKCILNCCCCCCCVAWFVCVFVCQLLIHNCCCCVPLLCFDGVWCNDVMVQWCNDAARDPIGALPEARDRYAWRGSFPHRPGQWLITRQLISDSSQISIARAGIHYQYMVNAIMLCLIWWEALLYCWSCWLA